MLLLDDEQRRTKRLAASMTVSVKGQTRPNVSWTEVTPIGDVSALGAAFKLSRVVVPGNLLQMTLKMPRELRGYDFREEDYNVWGVVRRCIKTYDTSTEPHYVVGVAFVGQSPPSNYVIDPSACYEVEGSEPKNGFWKVTGGSDHIVAKPIETIANRRQTRLEIPEEVCIEIIDGFGNTAASETTVTLNISRSGAAVYSQLPVEIGSLIRLSNRRHNVQLMSVVRGRQTDPSGLSRVNLEFVDQAFPIDLI